MKKICIISLLSVVCIFTARSPEGTPVGRIRNVRFSFIRPDARKDFYLEDAEDIEGLNLE